MSDLPAIPEYAKPVIAAKTNFLKVADEATFVREAGFAVQALQSNSLLLKCTPASIQNAVLNVALTGITLNPAMKLAYLVPRDGQCCLDFSYRGLIKAAVDSGAAVSINASVVYEWDDFSYEMGSEQNLSYKPNMNPPVDMDEIIKDPVKIWKHVVAAFSIARLPNGTSDFVILPAWRLKKIMETSKGKENPKMPWMRWPEEQMRKTAVKYHSKTLQGYARNDRLAKAVEIQNELDGIDLDLKNGAHSKELEGRFDLQPDPMCICAEMIRDKESVWDCPKCGRKDLHIVKS